jgi:Fe2+ transport system protein FeoA
VSTTSTKLLSELEIKQKAVVKYTNNALLQELGFIHGEHVAILAKASFGGPIAVRIGASVFALRLDEAAQVIVY